MSIREAYVSAIREVMAERGVEGAETQPSPAVPYGASLADALQYTDWYATKRGNEEEHYRFGRYYNAIEKSLRETGHKWAHIDVGCGAGLFWWAFLDWAAEHGVERSGITLYGYDACREMVRLAWMLRAKLGRTVPDYPDLRYASDSGLFIRKLAGGPIDANCLMTFGYVLAGNHSDDDIGVFQRIAATTVNSVLHGRSVYLLASDATSGKNLGQLEDGWRKLLSALQAGGARIQQLPLATIYSGDRCVLLSRKEEVQR